MNKPRMSPERARERALFLYRSALERGDFETIAGVLKLAEHDPLLDSMLADMDELDAPPVERPQQQSGQPPQNDQYIKQIVTVHLSPPNGQTPKPDHSQEDNEMMNLTIETFSPERPRTLYPYAVRFVTLAAVILIAVFLGGILIEMVNDPIDGYPAIQALQTEAATCDTGLDYMAQGKSAITSGDYAAALTAYNCAIEIDLTNYLAYLYRGGLVAANGDYDQLAIDLYTIESHRAPGSDPIEVAIASEGKSLDDIVQSRPDDFVAHLLRVLVAWVPFESGVQPNMERMIELEPENPLGYLFLGARNIASADSLPAEFQQGMTLAPDTVLIDWLLRRNETRSLYAETQKERLSRAITANPAHPFAYLYRALDHIELGDPAAAAQDFYQHLEINQAERVEVDGFKLGERQVLEGAAGRVFQIPMTLQTGQILDIRPDEERNNNGILESMVVLDPQGNVIAAPYLITSVNLVIEGLEIPASGTYALLVMSSSETELTLQMDVDTTASTTFLSQQFALPMSISFNSKWSILDDFSDLVTVKRNSEGWELGFNIVTSATVTDPVSGDRVPFPEDFSSWIQSNPDFQTDQPIQVMVGDLQGLQIDATPTIMTRKTFLYMIGTRWNLVPQPERWRFILLYSISGERLLVLLISPTEEFDAAVEKAQVVLNNVVFSP